MHFELRKLNDILFVETNPVPVKTALHIMGKMKKEFRLPLARLSDESFASLRQVLKEYQLI